MTTEVLRLAAFPLGRKGGNPAGVVLEAGHLSSSEMQQIAAEVGFSETVFILSRNGSDIRVKYFSPEMEVDFCGHATIAAGVALGGQYGVGDFVFETNNGPIKVFVSDSPVGLEAEISTTKALVSGFEPQELEQLLEILHLSSAMLAEGFEPKIANAGNAHPVIVLKSLDLLEQLDYEFEELKQLCRIRKWITIQIVAREAKGIWQSRNPFAFGGVYEDPATGSAAAALGVYFRELGEIKTGETFTIKQGIKMGQPCLISVRVGEKECSFSGTAIPVKA